MTVRHHNDGLRKRCGCPRRQWAKCPHPWSFNFQFGGIHYRRSLGPTITSKTDARDAADRLRTEIRSGTHRPHATVPVTLEQLLAVYFERHVAINRQASLANEESSRAVILRTEIPTADGQRRAFRDWPITDVTADTLERFKEVRLAQGAGRGRVAINRNLTLLRAAFNWAIHPGGYLTTTPFKIGPVTAVKLFSEAARERRLEPGEEGRLLAACGPHLRALVEAALETSCRKGELLSLQWRQVRMAQNEIHLPAGKTKAKKPRYVPISPRLHAILDMRRLAPDGTAHEPDAYVFGNELGEQVKTVKTAWRLACSRAAITGLHFHDLRREAASRLLEGNVPEHYVQAVLGHADLSTTSKYLATTRKGLHQIMGRYERGRAEQPRASMPASATGEDSATSVPNDQR